MVNWRTDDEIVRAHNAMHTAFNFMFDNQPTGVTDTVEAVQREIPHHRDCVLALDPSKIRDEYDRVFDAAMRIGQGEYALAYLRLTRDHLVEWTGKAADEFKLQLGHIETFCTRQQTLILEMLRGVVAVYALAVAGRASYLSIVTAAHDAAINVHDEQQTKETQAKVSIIADVLKGVVGIDPRALTRSFLDTAIDVGKDLATYLIDDSGADQVALDYRRRADELCQSMGHALDDVRDQFANQRDDLAENLPVLFKPLPAICDVDSPDFSYEHFKSDVHVNPDSVVPVVEAERRKYVEEKATRGSEIERRLNHGDKGAI